MTKHRTITGFVVFALLAVAATAATMRSYSPSTERILVAAGGNLAVDVNKLQIEEFDDQSLVYSSKR